MLRFRLFSLRGVGYEPEAVRIRQLAYKMGYIASLLPLRRRFQPVGHTGRRVAPPQSFSHLIRLPLDDFSEYSSHRAASRVWQALDFITLHGRYCRVDLTVPAL